jgi:hypothetical protein
MLAVEQDADVMRTVGRAARQLAEAPYQRILPAGNALHLW